MSSNIHTVDDGDNRTRNAKAQRRHREKRKAHMKQLEEAVATLQSQLEDARRAVNSKLSPLNHHNGSGSPTFPPGSSEQMNRMMAENNYLREENTALRHQLHSYQQHFPPPPRPQHQGSMDEGSAGDSGRSRQGSGQMHPPSHSVKNEGDAVYAVGGQSGGPFGPQDGYQSVSLSGLDGYAFESAQRPTAFAQNGQTVLPPLERFNLQMPKSPRRVSSAPGGSSYPYASPDLRNSSHYPPPGQSLPAPPAHTHGEMQHYSHAPLQAPRQMPSTASSQPFYGEENGKERTWPEQRTTSTNSSSSTVGHFPQSNSPFPLGFVNEPSSTTEDDSWQRYQPS